MAYVNQRDEGGKCSAIGEKAEVVFAELATQKGYKVTPASREENIHKHIDFILSKEKSSKVFKIDVKARKKNKRKDSNFNDDWLWLEFDNVQGKDGWLKGKATHIAFEREGEFALVPRAELLEWSKKKIAENNGGRITIKAKVSSATKAKYKLYTRWRRQDLLTQVAYDDMIKEMENILIWTK
jgi:flagellar basal body rod protein FlgG